MNSNTQHANSIYCVSSDLSQTRDRYQGTESNKRKIQRNDVSGYSLSILGNVCFKRIVELCTKEREKEENRTSRWKERTREGDIVKRRFRVPARKLQMRRVSRSNEADWRTVLRESNTETEICLYSSEA